jgi:predicted AAA+ superfamily ATPase
MTRDVILEQRRELERRLSEPYVARRAGQERARAAADLVRVVIGPRRAGKSFYAMHLVRDLGSFGYVNFDDERLLGPSADLDAVIAAIDSVYDHPKHLLLDEVQNVPGWELLVNRLQRQGYRLVLTGSNAHLLGSELATHLTGRHLPIVLFPFSFAESLEWERRDAGLPTAAETKAAFDRYLETGGYPEPLVKGVPYRDYLTALVRSTLYKDIVVRHRVRSPQGLDDLASHLLANVSSRYSYRRLMDLSRLKSQRGVEAYSRYLEEAFLFFSLKRFSHKVREQAKAPRKAYALDNGLVTYASFRAAPDRGRLLENAVAASLHRSELEGDCELFYWQGDDQHEVDFVVKRGPRVTGLIQVCLEPGPIRTRDRETRALVKAGAALDCRDLTVVTGGYEAEADVSWFGATGRIRFVPAWKWFEER